MTGRTTTTEQQKTKENFAVSSSLVNFFPAKLRLVQHKIRTVASQGTFTWAYSTLPVFLLSRQHLQ